MRCPKCHYISFDSGERCRNCGYDFSLALDLPPEPELPLRGEPEGGAPLADFSLDHSRHSAPAAAELPDSPLRSSRTPPGGSGLDLPLFAGRAPGEGARPLTRASSTPRPPLAVRRATPEVARVRSEPVPPRARPRAARLRLEPPTSTEPAAGPTATVVPAGFARRLTAGTIDLALLGGIDAAVVYFTLRLCHLTVAEIALLPVLPLAAFFLLLNGGYFVMFTTVSGQTLGKMAVRIRVVGDGDARVTLGGAVVRTAACLLSALPLGLGFLPGLMGRDRRALHDRLAATRVVRAWR